MSNELQIASFFAGVGGIDIAFQQAGAGVVYANEYDQYAVQTYENNFGMQVDHRDINDVQASEVPDHDIMLGGFPCQAFSIAGNRQGFLDEKGRGNLFFEMERLFNDKKPSIIFLENVKNLVGHDNGNTFRIITERLEEAGYHVKYQVMNAKDYGNVPQNRERIYIVAFRDVRQYQLFDFPKPIPLTRTLRDVIDFENEQEERYYYTKEKYAFYDMLDAEMTNRDSVYQWRRVYVRENKSGVSPTLTANMGTGGHNVPLIRTDDGRIRKLTPRECFNLQGYPSNYRLPENMSNTRLYKQAGNSVVVPVIRRIAENIMVAVEATERATVATALNEQ